MRPNTRPFTMAKQAAERRAAAAASSAAAQTVALTAPEPPTARKYPAAFALGGSPDDAQVVYRDGGRIAYTLGRDGSVRCFSLKAGGEVRIPVDLLPTVRALFAGPR